MRTVSSVFLALLLLAALFWGNCFSCPQLFLYAASESSPHGCCHPKGSPHRVDCQSLSLKNFVRADIAPELPSLAAWGPAIRTEISAPATAEPPALILPQASPPDLLVLLSVFRI
ncbi:MAG TPA: hypothetical protein VFA33_25375 [Bryobacteraceae bacterium]|nr:hypothetical protein [Bryobacteraceae bacterium]